MRGKQVFSAELAQKEMIKYINLNTFNLMKEQNINIKNILPTHKAPEGMWDKIEEQLDFLDEEKIDKKIKAKLPSYHAPEIFENIAPPPKAKMILFYLTRVAAVAVIVIGFTFGFKQVRNKAHIEISHSFEQNTKQNTIEHTDLFLLDNEFKDILSQICKTKPGVCEKKEYEELYAQLKDIENETIKLQEVLKQFKSPDIQSHLVRLTNDKIKLENYILNLFS